MIAQCSNNIPLSLAPHISKSKSLKRLVQRQRKEDFVAPKSLKEVIVADNYKVTKRGDKFLFIDTNDDERILIFTTLQNLQLLKESSMILVDGTFKTCPVLFSQIFTVHGIKEKLSIPN